MSDVNTRSKDHLSACDDLDHKGNSSDAFPGDEETGHENVDDIARVEKVYR